VAFIICLAALGIPGDESHIAQMTAIAEADGASEQETERLVRDVRQVISLVRKEASETEIRPLISRMLRRQWALMSQASEKDATANATALDAHVDCALSLYKSPWFKFFIDYDPKPALEQVACPALFLFGELDTQIPTEVNRTAIREILEQSGNNDYALKTISKANHVFHGANTGSPSEYMRLEKKFAAGFLESISEWLLEHVCIVTE
jgi:pimeloyl-ACP methyl ester carboxylesterase